MLFQTIVNRPLILLKLHLDNKIYTCKFKTIFIGLQRNFECITVGLVLEWNWFIFSAREVIPSSISLVSLPEWQLTSTICFRWLVEMHLALHWFIHLLPVYLTIQANAVSCFTITFLIENKSNQVVVDLVTHKVYPADILQKLGWIGSVCVVPSLSLSYWHTHTHARAHENTCSLVEPNATHIHLIYGKNTAI